MLISLYITPFCAFIMLYLAAYDIEHNPTRQRVATRLLALGLERIQLSVFVGPLSPTQCEQLLTWAQKQLAHNPSDKLLLLPLDQYSIENATHLGESPPDWEYLAGNLPVLIV